MGSVPADDQNLVSHAKAGVPSAQFALGEKLEAARDIDAAGPWYRRAARHGHPDAELALGRWSEEGIGRERRSLGGALRWYRKAAAKGNVEAMTRIAELGLHFRRGSDNECVTWLQRAVALGSHRAEFVLGDFYYRGIGVQENRKLAAEYCRRAAESGDSIAQATLARLLEAGDGVEQDVAQAESLCKLAAASGNEDAYEQLYQLYNSGADGFRNPEKALRWFLKALPYKKYGPIWRELNLAKPLPKDYGRNTWELELAELLNKVSGEQAYEAFATEASFGSAYAQMELARRLFEGVGVNQDTAAAAVWCRKAAMQDLAPAQLLLAEILESKKDDPTAETAALYWRQMGRLVEKADEGDPESRFRLGMMYENGDGVVADPERAARYYEATFARSAHPGGFERLAALYRRGRGVRKDKSVARYLGKLAQIVQAVEGGNAAAQVKLAKWHDENGRRKEADALLELASGQGSEEASLRLAWRYKHPVTGSPDYRYVARTALQRVENMRRLAEQGDPEAQVDYAMLHFSEPPQSWRLKTWPVWPKDQIPSRDELMQTARTWIERAAAQGHQLAIRFLQEPAIAVAKYMKYDPDADPTNRDYWEEWFERKQEYLQVIVNEGYELWLAKLEDVAGQTR